MIGWLDGKEDLLEQAGVDPIAAVELECAIEAVKVEIQQPKAKTMMFAALSAGMSKEMVLTLYHRTVSAMHAMAPIVALKLSEKMDDENAPGSTRVIIEMAKGLGLFVAAEPMAAKNRGDILEEGSLSSRSSEDLKAEILRAI